MVTTTSKQVSGKGSKKAGQAKRAGSSKSGMPSNQGSSATDTSITSRASMAISSDQRQKMIETAAWLRAENRGFVGDCCMDDWLMAEAEIDDMLTREQQNTPVL
jgi:hypothetical protein